MFLQLLAAADRLWQKQSWLPRAISMAAIYAAWTSLFRLLILTFVTFFLLPPGFVPTGGPGFWASRDSRPIALPKFEEITDILSANELPLLGFSALLFVSLLRWLHPLTSTTTEQIITSSRVRERFMPGFVHGATFAIGIILGFLISGSYQYLGLYLQFDELALALPSILLRIAAILAFVYSEEFLFRRRLLEHFRMGLAAGKADQANLRSDVLAAAFTGVFYCAIKVLQFDLGVMQLLTLFLLSLVLGIQSSRSGDFARGAGFWAALLMIFHVLFSLPILGTDFSGILMVKYQASADDGVAVNETTRLLSGGAGGPLSSVALQILLLIELGRTLLRRRKYFRSSSSSR